MRMTQETVQGPMYRSSILDEYFTEQQIVVADIETTGLSPRNCSVILGGLTVAKGDDRLAVQYFADRLEDEAELLDRYAGMLIRYDTVVTFNGNSFDLPFLKKRMKALGINPSGLEEQYSFDLYRIIKKYSMLPEILPDLKQKTVEKYMGLSQSRSDTIDGAQSVRLYFEYLQSKGNRREQLLDQILLHNRDDIVKLSELLPILRQLDLHEIFFKEGFPVKTAGQSTSGQRATGGRSNGQRTPGQRASGQRTTGHRSNGQRAVIKNLKINKKGLRIEGIVSGNPMPYQGFASGVETLVEKRGSFTIHVDTEEAGGYQVADLRHIEADCDELASLPGYESGYLILLDPEKKVRYHEVNRLAAKMTAGLMEVLSFQHPYR